MLFFDTRVHLTISILLIQAFYLSALRSCVVKVKNLAQPKVWSDFHSQFLGHIYIITDRDVFVQGGSWPHQTVLGLSHQKGHVI